NPSPCTSPPGSLWVFGGFSLSGVDEFRGPGDPAKLEVTRSTPPKGIGSRGNEGAVMTLTTRAYVHDQISRSEVMDYCNRLLEAPKDVATRDDEMWLAEDGRRVMGNLPCQGLDGLLKVYYRAN